LRLFRYAHGRRRRPGARAVSRPLAAGRVLPIVAPHARCRDQLQAAGILMPPDADHGTGPTEAIPDVYSPDAPQPAHPPVADLPFTLTRETAPASAPRQRSLFDDSGQHGEPY